LIDCKSNRIAQKHPRPLICVAIPVCDEIERVGRCVEALSEQRDSSGLLLGRGQVRVVLMANGCTDGTYEFLLRNLESFRIAVTAYHVRLPETRRNAGFARRMANHAAIELLHAKSGLLFMTDADSVAPPQWIASYWEMLRGGYDAIAGQVDLNPDDSNELLPLLHDRGTLEEQYTLLLDQLDSIVDPIPHDPWPRHYNASGANIAVRLDALRGICDFPIVPCGEDRLLIKMLEAQGRRVRHDCTTRVLTSGRLFGRAPGGMADTLRRRLKVPLTPCDARLEAAQAAYQRALLRKRLREAWINRDLWPSAAELWVRHLKIEDQLAIQAGGYSHFDDIWQKLEWMAPQLKRVPILPSQLPTEIRNAQQIIESLANDYEEAWDLERSEVRA
jgi:cellulose synthase/poly-beta-1,6-N-acetylglucosamine synthase-like glycosyltransferase